jgi:hypothetical protein
VNSYPTTIGELPQSLLDEIKSIVVHYTVGLLADTALAGTGTLVEYMGVHYVLTAHHVWEKCLSKPEVENVGFILSHQEYTSRLPTKYIDPIVVGSPISDEAGPDVILLKLPVGAPILQAIKAKKSFFKIDFELEEKLHFCSDKMDLYAIAGFIGERTKAESRPHGIILTCHANMNFTGIERSFDKDEFDYEDCLAVYTDTNDLPNSFGGTSGGGLWKIELFTGNQIGRIVLSGVAFYQSEQLENERFLRCHGPKTIYQKVPQILKK